MSHELLNCGQVSPNGTQAPAPYVMRRLEQVGVRVLDCEHRTPKFQRDGFPYVAIPNIRDGRLELSDVARISPEDFEAWTRRTRPQGGDIILTRRGRVGDTCVVPEGLECALGQNLVIVRSNSSHVEQSYLRWALRGSLYQQQVNKWINVGAVFDSLNVREIPKFEIPVPSKPIQRAIAHILGTLDDKIALNRRQNQTLEELARALFTSWFVTFDPVRAKAAGRQPEGMDAETAALFPNEFEDSELGEIPKGWAVGRLDEAIEVNPPRRLARSEVAPYLDMASMPTIGVRALDWIERPFNSGSRFANGDVLLARITPCLENGKTAFVDFLADGQVGWGSTEYIVLRSRRPLPLEWAYYLARSEEFRSHAIGAMTGTSGRQRVPSEAVARYPIVTPPSPIADRFGQVTRGLIETMKANDQQSSSLAAMRDLLLPRLLSGELKVETVEPLRR